MSCRELPFDLSAIAQLQLTPLFVGVVESDLRDLLGEASIHIRSDAEPLFAKGAPAGCFFVLLDGHVELFAEEGGRTRVLEVVKPPALVGEAALFVDGLYSEAARVVGYAKVVAVPAPHFLAVLDQRFDLAQRMLGSMSMRLRGLVGQISQLKLKTTAQRVAGFLLGLTSVTEGPAVVRFPYDKRLAAGNLGMSAESLSRALLRLAELGVESRAENVVAIGDVASLRSFCAEEDE
jgi:CRP/FNR family transcriptional activator FtrB